MQQLHMKPHLKYCAIIAQELHAIILHEVTALGGIQQQQEA